MTNKQLLYMSMIKMHWIFNHAPPTIREVATMMCVKSSSAYDMVCRLKKSGELLDSHHVIPSDMKVTFNQEHHYGE
jgi:hypothetical protein